MKHTRVKIVKQGAASESIWIGELMVDTYRYFKDIEKANLDPATQL